MKKNIYFGQFLLRNKVITLDQLQIALKAQSDMGVSIGQFGKKLGLFTEREIKQILLTQWQINKPFGQIAVLLGIITADQMDDLVEQHSQFHTNLGDVLVEQGFLNEATLSAWLKRFNQQKHGSKDIIQALSKVELFSNLNDQELTTIGLHLRIHYYNANDIIYNEGDPSNDLFIIESGSVQIIRYLAPGKTTKHNASDTENFGVYSLLTRKPRNEKATANTNSTIWQLSWEDLHSLLMENPRLSTTALKHLTTNIKDMIVAVKDEYSIEKEYIAALIVDTSIEYCESLAYTIVEHVAKEISKDTLFISCIQDDPHDSSVLLKRPDGLKEEIGLFHVDLYKYTSLHDIETLLENCQSYQMSFGCIIVLVSIEAEKLAKRILRVCHKTVIFPQEQSIHLLFKYFDPKRDQVYFVRSHKGTLNDTTYKQQLLAAPNVAVHSIFDWQDTTNIATQIVRWFLGRTIGFAFGGGGARSMTLVGVIEVIQKEGIPIDIISGASGGSLYAALVALGYDAKIIAEITSKSIKYGKSHPFNDYSLGFKSFIKGNKYRSMLQEVLGERQSYDTLIPLYIVATNLDNGDEVIMNDCLLWQSIYVSTTIPGYLPVIPVNDMRLVDGSLVNNIPSTILKKYGADLVVSVNLSPKMEQSPIVTTSIPSVLGRSIDILMHQSAEVRSRYTDIEIRPQLQEYGMFDFKKGMEMYERGRMAAYEKLDEIKSKLDTLYRRL